MLGIDPISAIRRVANKDCWEQPYPDELRLARVACDLPRPASVDPRREPWLHRACYNLSISQMIRNVVIRDIDRQGPGSLERQLNGSGCSAQPPATLFPRISLGLVAPTHHQAPGTRPRRLLRRRPDWHRVHPVRQVADDLRPGGNVSLICVEQKRADVGCGITRQQSHLATGSPPRLGRSEGSSARRDGVGG